MSFNMYKLWNKLFGWDYIHWTSSATAGIARVLVDAEGNPYYYRHGIYINKLVNNSPTARPWEDRVVWLTCKRDKYLK